jgi:hypothetical protein
MAAFLALQSWAMCSSHGAGGRRCAYGTLRGSPAISALRCRRVTNASSPRSICWRSPCPMLSPAPAWTKLRYRRRTSVRDAPNGLRRPSAASQVGGGASPIIARRLLQGHCSGAATFPAPTGLRTTDRVNVSRDACLSTTMPLNRPLKQLSTAAMASARGLRVNTAQMPHSLREIAFDRLDHGVVDHQAVGVTGPVVALHHLCQNTQEALPIFVVCEDRLAPVATRGDVIQGAGRFDARGSRQAKSRTEPLRCQNARPHS